MMTRRKASVGLSASAALAAASAPALARDQKPIALPRPRSLG